ncbi:MAG: hypothetical protein LAT68_11115 [Cyclobacteriaceae bacterium]|nr:hypothetical protein [Cyclobacteriaceae bacterium]MCH8516865.1 hypothetical protein [Cyclobacteriaceae bacterium]
MKTIIVFFFLTFSCLYLLGQDNYRLKRVIKKYEHGERNIRESYYVIRPKLFITFRPHLKTKHGLYERFFLNGNISERKEYKLGEVIWYQRFNNNGDILEEHADSTGITVKRVFQNTRLQEVKRYKNGIKHGTWITYERRPFKSKTEEYDNGELVSAVLQEYSEFEKHEFFSFAVSKTTDLLTGETSSGVFVPPVHTTVDFPNELIKLRENVVVCAEITINKDCNYSYILVKSFGPETDRIAMDIFDEYVTFLPKFKERHNIKCENKSYTFCVQFLFR